MTDRGQRKASSNNINININLLSMKDGVKPIGKKIQNNIRIGTSGMEAKRMTLLTQRLQEKKRQIETYHDPDESEYMKSKMNGYTTKKQRSKTNKVNQDQMVTAFSTTNARGKFNSRDIKDIKDTPNKPSKIREEDFSTKTKKNLSGEKMKSRRDSRGSHSTGNLHKVRVYKSPSKSETNSNPRSKSNKKRQRIMSKNKQKMSLDVNNKPSIRQIISSNHDTIKTGKSKPQMQKAKDDAFIKKKPVQVKKPTKIKTPLTSMIDEPVKFPLSKNSRSRKSSVTRLPKYSDKKQKSPQQKKKKPISITDSQTINKAAIYIQKVWRGYWQRKNLKTILESLLNRNKKIKSLISANKKQFWKDVSEDSIKYVDVQIQDSFAQQSIHSQIKNPLQLFSGEQVQSVQGQFDELNPFDKLIKMSQQVGDYKLARELRNMAQNLIKQQIQKKQIIRQNKQLKQDIIQLKQESIHHAIPIPLILPERKYQNQFIQPTIVMPVKKIQKIEEIETVEKNQKIQINGNQEIKQYKEIRQKIVRIQKEQKPVQVVHKVEQKPNMQDFHSAKQYKQQENQQDAVEKRRLIQQLKSFKGESDGLMKKIGKNKQPQTDKQQPKNNFPKISQDKKHPEKITPIFEKHEFDYQQMNNQSSDSQQFKQAIRKSEQDNYSKQRNELFNKQSQKQIKDTQIINKPPSILPDIKNQCQNSQSNNSESGLQDSQRSQINPLVVQKKGFETNLNFVKQYCIGLCQFVRNSQQIKAQFKRKVIKPMRINILELLKSYRQTIEGEQNNEFNSFKYDYVYPYYRDTVPLEYLITQKTFEEFNATLPNLKRNSEGEKTDIELEAIHLKSLLDVFNESLNYERPSSIHGEPLPWAPKVKHLKNVNNTFQQTDIVDNEYSKQNQKFDQLFGVSIARVIQWGSSLCGFIPESLDMDSNIQIDQQYINHIKQTRMALMLEKTLAEDQQKMLQFVDVETEVKLEISSKIMQDLLEQLLEQIPLQYLN